MPYPILSRNPRLPKAIGVLSASAALTLLLFTASASPLSAQTPTPADPSASPKAPSASQTGRAPHDQTGAAPAGGGPGRRRGGGGGGADAAGDKAEKNTYDYYLPGADGKDISLASYKGKFLVIVNLGRKSSYTGQLPALIKLNDTYKSKDVVVIGVPSNEFGSAEPGTNAEIQKAYTDAKVDFTITGVAKLTGDDELPFFTYLTTSKSAPAGGAVAWNYTKFIVDKKGNVVARLDPDITPDSPEFLATLDEILDGTYKPKKVSGGAKSGGSAPE